LAKEEICGCNERGHEDVREDEAEDRLRWKQMIRCGDP